MTRDAKVCLPNNCTKTIGYDDLRRLQDQISPLDRRAERLGLTLNQKRRPGRKPRGRL